MVKNLPAKQETRVQSLSWKDMLEKEMETDSSILAWEIPWAEGAWRGYSPLGRKESDVTERLNKQQRTVLGPGGRVQWLHQEVGRQIPASGNV